MASVDNATMEFSLLCVFTHNKREALQNMPTIHSFNIDYIIVNDANLMFVWVAVTCYLHEIYLKSIIKLKSCYAVDLRVGHIIIKNRCSVCVSSLLLAPHIFLNFNFSFYKCIHFRLQIAANI